MKTTRKRGAAITLMALAVVVATLKLTNSLVERSSKIETVSSVHPAVLTGTVVDGRTNAAVGQAVLTAVGFPGSALSADTGAFRFAVHAQNGSSLRLRVEKFGYKPVDELVTVPTDPVIVQLEPIGRSKN